MRAVAAVAQRLARFRDIFHASHFNFEFALKHGQAFHRTMLMRFRGQHTTGLSAEHIPLQPFNSFDPADDGQMAFAIFRDEDRRFVLR